MRDTLVIDFDMNISSPKTENEFLQYYNLRWRILRKPWDQPKGSEEDDKEDKAYHLIASKSNIVIAVARLEFLANNNAQLRYMAVDRKYQRKGIGHQLINHMEYYARKISIDKIFLHARENAVGFYEKQGYVVTEKSYLLFDSIQHFKMLKKL